VSTLRRQATTEAGAGTPLYLRQCLLPVKKTFMMRRLILLIILLLAAVLGSCRPETQPEVIVITAPPTPVVATDSVAPAATTASPSAILGLRCAFAGTGATLAFGDKRANFTCAPGDEQVLLGDVVLTGRGWEIERAVIANTASGSAVQSSEMAVVTQIELVDGTLCSFAGTGATLAFGDKRANFTCTPRGDVVLLGETTLSDRGWEIEKALLTSTDSGFTLQSSEMVPIAALVVPATTSAAAPAPVQATATSTFAPAPQGVNRPIQFAAGATSATVENTVVAGAVDRYTLRAQAGQTMRVELSSDGYATLLVEAPNGQLLTGGAAGAVLDQWEDQLPVTGDYVILVRTTIGDASYRLVVTIPPLAAESASGGRIEFAPGATSATYSGFLEASGIGVRYFFTAAAGQTVTIDFTPAATLDVSMMGPDNSHHVDNDAGRLETVLPQTGEYILDVIAMNAENGVQYQFTITIE